MCFQLEKTCFFLVASLYPGSSYLFIFGGWCGKSPKHLTDLNLGSLETVKPRVVTSYFANETGKNNKQLRMMHGANLTMSKAWLVVFRKGNSTTFPLGDHKIFHDRHFDINFPLLYLLMDRVHWNMFHRIAQVLSILKLFTNINWFNQMELSWNFHQQHPSTEEWLNDQLTVST